MYQFKILEFFDRLGKKVVCPKYLAYPNICFLIFVPSYNNVLVIQLISKSFGGNGKEDVLKGVKAEMAESGGSSADVIGFMGVVCCLSDFESHSKIVLSFRLDEDLIVLHTLQRLISDAEKDNVEASTIWSMIKMLLD